jgi:ribosome-associated heat shock protein Hsp15
MENKTEIVRLDKWLWAARFFKTRSLASQAIKGGKVQVNGNRGKAAHNVSVDNNLIISIGVVEFHIKVLALSRFRRPAVEARLLYVESEESQKKREEARALRKMANAGYSSPAKRPSKRDRRKIKSFTRKD